LASIFVVQNSQKEKEMAYYKVRNVVEALELRISQTTTKTEGYEELKQKARDTDKRVKDHVNACVSGAVVSSVYYAYGEPDIRVRLTGEAQDILRVLCRAANDAEKELRQFEYDWKQKQTRTMDIAELKGFLIVAKERDPEKAINTPMSVHRWLDPAILNKD
jgi:hypothetical protein